MALGNPMEAFLEVARMKNQNRRQSYGDIAGIGYGMGEGLASIGEIIGEQKKKAIVQQLMAAMSQQGAPQQGPPLPMSGTVQQPNLTQIPSGQPMTAGGSNIGQDVQMPQPIPTQPQGQQPTSGMGAPAQDNTQLINSLLMKYDPQSAIKSMMPTNPLQQSEVAKNNAMADWYKTRNATGGASKPVGTIYRSSSTGEMTDDPSKAQGPDWKEYKTTQGDILSKLAGQTSGEKRNKSLSSRSEAMERRTDVQQIDRLAQTVGLTSAQRNLLQQNNMRANRAIEIAQKAMTWQEFGAVTTDAAAIMQGGSPQVQQLHDMSYPSWKQDLAQAQTYMTSTPTANVPDEFKQRIIGMIKGIQTVDNRYLQKNAEFMQKMLAPTIRGGIGQFKKPIADMTNTITESGDTQANGSGWSVVK